MVMSGLTRRQRLSKRRGRHQEEMEIVKVELGFHRCHRHRCHVIVVDVVVVVIIIVIVVIVLIFPVIVVLLVRASTASAVLLLSPF